MKMYLNSNLRQLTEMNKHYIEKLAEFYANLSIDNIPADVVDKAKTTLLDYLFVYVVGYHKGVLNKHILQYVKERTKKNESSINLSGIKTDAELAILASALISHSVELDDGHRYGTAHPAVVVIPTVLAFGEKQHSNLSKILKAIIIAYDVMLRISKSINPSHLKRGFHSSSTTGTIGSAAAASVIMGFDAERMTHAMAISGLFSSGLQEMLHSNPSVKALQVGHSAKSGASAALFANHNIKGPLSLLEGQHGWLKAMTDDFKENELLSELGTRWEIMNTYTKLYPTCRHCHHALDLAIEAFNMGFDIDRIKHITVRTYYVGIVEVGIIKKPKDIEEAMFSLSYAVTIALKKGFLKIENLEDYLEDPQIIAFSSSIEIIEDEGMNTKYPHERGCVLEITPYDGETFTLMTHLPKGEPDTKLSDEEYVGKFKSITSNYVDDKFVDNMYDLIMGSNENDVVIPKIASIYKTKLI